MHPKLLPYMTRYVKCRQIRHKKQKIEQISSFQKISPHELIDNTIWPLKGVKFPLP